MDILILGGTRDAMNLADELLAHPGLRPTYSLAGRTRRPLSPALPTRRGGFGGVDGLARWLAAHRIGAVVDATHPFAARMSANAAGACHRLGVPLARLERRPWTPEPDDRWLPVADLNTAAQTLERLTRPGQRIWLTTGRTGLSAFEGLGGRHFVVRTVDPPQPPPAFDRWSLIEDRGPFTLAGERRIIAGHRIDFLVCKNSGGKAARPKLRAAREAGIPVVMVERPVLPPVEVQHYSVADAVEWLSRLSS